MKITLIEWRIHHHVDWVWFDELYAGLNFRCRMGVVNVKVKDYVVEVTGNYFKLLTKYLKFIPESNALLILPSVFYLEHKKTNVQSDIVLL